MQLKLRRAITMLVWAASLVAAGPAIGYAQGASERLSSQVMARDQQADISEYASANPDMQDGAEQDE